MDQSSFANESSRFTWNIPILCKRKQRKLPWIIQIHFNIFTPAPGWLWGTPCEEFYFTLQFPFDIRHGRPATKTLPRKGRKNRGKKIPWTFEKLPVKSTSSTRSQPDVHLIIITPNESHSHPFTLGVMDFCGNFECRSPSHAGSSSSGNMLRDTEPPTLYILSNQYDPRNEATRKFVPRLGNLGSVFC